LKLEKLTKEQELLMYRVRDEWIQNAFTYEPTRQQDIQSGIDWIYTKIGKQTPPIFIFDSFWGKQLGYNILGNSVRASVWDSVWDSVSDSVRDSVGDSVRDSVWDSVSNSVRDSVSNSVRDSVWDSVSNSVRDSVSNSVRDSVRDSVRNSVRDSVRNSVRDSVSNSVRDSVSNSVRASVRDSVGDSVRDSVWDSVSDSVRDSVGDSVRDSVWDSVWDSVSDSVRDSVGDSVRDSVWDSVWDSKLEFTDHCFGSGYDSGWLAFYDYFTKIGILHNSEFEIYRGLMRKVWAIDFYECACIVCRKPRKVLKKNGRLHALGEPAVQWADGSGNWFIDGVSFDTPFFSQEYGKLPMAITNKTISAKQVLQLTNIEQRQVALKYLGPEKLIAELDAKLIDESTRGNRLYAISGISLDSTRVMKLLKYKDPSTERVYVSCVPDEMQKADEAMAWKFWLTEAQYKILEVEA
jgi:hypothetical protein